MDNHENNEHFLKALKRFYSQEIDEYKEDNLYETFKGLRDLGIKNRQYENESCLKEECLNYTIDILNKLFIGYHVKFLPAMGQALQFIHNLTVQNIQNQLHVWNNCEEHLKTWMELKNEKLRNYMCGIIYNVILGRPRILLDILKDTALISHIFSSAVEGTDFSILITENIKQQLLDKPDLFMDSFFLNGTPHHIKMLDILYECVQDKDVSLELVVWIKEKFKNKAISLNITEETQSNDFQEIYYLLKILVVFSGKDNINAILQSDMNLLDETKIILEKIHIEGKKSGSVFAPTENIMTERTSIENLKTNLIRLIGNLCWRNKIFQDRMRELEGIPIILDCCIRDGKNPFITESVVFTIRNLCEGNFENQNYIKNINQITHDEMSERSQDWPSFFIPNG